MNNSELYKICHSSDMKLTPIKNLHNDEIEELIIENDLDIEKFYKVEGKLYPYCYINNTVFVEIYSMDKEYFEGFKIKNMIKAREQHHKECFDKKDYRRLFCIIDKPFRLEWFKKLYNDIPQKDKLEIFKGIYSSMEYGFKEISNNMLKELYKNYNFDRSKFDDIVIIYRGEASKSNSYKNAYSWSLDLETAMWFANRFNSNGKVYKGKVKKENILDYITDRDEDEILVLSENIFDIEEIER